MASASDEELINLFASVGFTAKQSTEIKKNNHVSTELGEIIQESLNNDGNNNDDINSSLYLHLATSICKEKSSKSIKRSLISKGIRNGDLKSTRQIDAAFSYLKSNGENATREQMNLESGVGINVTEEEVKSAVDKYFKDNSKEIETKRYKSIAGIMSNIKTIPELKWANPALFKPIIDSKLLEVLGPKDDRDIAKKKEKKPNKKNTSASDKKLNAEEKISSYSSMFSEGFLGNLHKPGENPQAFEKFKFAHLKATGGKVVTRFPPEPNGYLHIGHSKAITVNFGYAKYNNGVCYLRFDDTNPEAEEEQYFTSIKEIVTWLGFTPYKITYSSDYFDQLYELAEFLIEKNKGYICQCTPEQVKFHRGVDETGKAGGKRTPCVHRSRSIEENLKLFREMKEGKYQPGEITLRMKQDLENPNPQMWDLVAYRVLNTPHHRTGSKWKIYPTYDFTHCLVDSMENISHSLCTTEFYLSRESYEWLCDSVEVYRPAQREYGRLNITGTIMSKRKIAKLVTNGFVRGWDDPRIFTLVGIRRRGVPPGAILNFVATLGVTTSNSNIQVVRFESAVRKYLEDTTPRLMMILDPVLVIVDNLPDDHSEDLSIPFKPGTPEMGEHAIQFTNKFYIDRSDYREEATKDYFRLAPGQSVGLLKVPHTVRVNNVIKDTNGKITEIHVHYENDLPKFKKPKTYIQWVPKSLDNSSPIVIPEIRIINQLFKSENPESNPNGYLADINPNSEEIIKNAMVEKGFWEVKKNSPWVVKGKESESGSEKKGDPETVRFQALRVGYFCLDKDSTNEKLVLNRIVSLKEDSLKK